ncbi:glycosyltransferase family 39 protein [Candidatus Roizmanbacteria bacterium]|nr:glycosyltransferase family 39 protein [Candidatus Roizmanbacteria bacterium]
MKSLIPSLFIIFLGIALYGSTIKGTFGNYKTVQQMTTLGETTKPFESSHERATFSQTISILVHKRFDLPLDFANFSAPDVGYHKGKFFSYFPPGISFLIMPLYLFGSTLNLNLLLAYATIPLISVLSLIMLYLIASQIFRFPLWVSLASVMIYAFATTSWSYAITIYQHSATTFLLLLMYYAVWKYTQAQKMRVVWALVVGFSYGVSFFFDYPNAFLLLPIMIYFLISTVRYTAFRSKITVGLSPTIILTGASVAIMMIIFGSYNYKTYGNWKTLANHLPRYEITNLEKIKQYEKQKVTARLGGVFLEERLPNGLYELTVAPDKGLFLFSPILLLAIIGIIMSSKKMKLDRFILLCIIFTNLLLYASFSDPWGGWAYGPRYLIPSMAILSLFVGVYLSSIRLQGIAKIATLILFIVSSSIALLGALTTNATPPQIEAAYFKIKYGILFNLDYLFMGKTGSYIYTTVFSHGITLLHYFFVIETLLLIIFSIVLFIVPRIFHYES